MAASFRNVGAAAPALVLLAARIALGAPEVTAKLPASGLPISLEAQSSEIDYRNNELLFRKVKITQGAMSVSADLARANGLDFENSHWVFRGDVRVLVNKGELRSDDADVTFANKLLSRAIVNGKPAQFSQVDPKSGRLVQGHAGRIDYDVRKGVVQLSNDAWLTDGRNEIRGEILKYDIAARSVVAEAGDQGSHRIHITINPPAPQKP